MKIQSQTKHQFKFTKQEIISILQSYIEQQGVIDDSCEVHSDNIPDQITLDMITKLEVTLDTDQDHEQRTDHFKSQKVANVNQTFQEGSNLLKVSKSNKIDNSPKQNSVQKKLVEASIHTTIASTGSTYQHVPLGTQVHPKDWDPFLD